MLSCPIPRKRRSRRSWPNSGKPTPTRTWTAAPADTAPAGRRPKPSSRGWPKWRCVHHYLLERLQGLYSRLEKSHQQLKISHEELERAQTAADPNRKNGFSRSVGRRCRPRAEQPHRGDHDVQPDSAERTEPERTMAERYHPHRPGSRPGGQDHQGPPQFLQGNQDQAGPGEHQQRDRRGLVASGQAVSLSQHRGSDGDWTRPSRPPSPIRTSSNRSFSTSS